MGNFIESLLEIETRLAEETLKEEVTKLVVLFQLQADCTKIDAQWAVAGVLRDYRSTVRMEEIKSRVRNANRL